MSNSSKDVNKKTHILFSHEIININDFDPNKIKKIKIHTKAFLFIRLQMWQPKIRKNCKFFILYFKQNEWIL